VSSQPGTSPWWLDVETGNTWQSGSAGQAMNVADLQGMVYALQSAGASTTGVYSTSYQWGQIIGKAPLETLSGIPDWIPGARTLSGAKFELLAHAIHRGRGRGHPVVRASLRRRLRLLTRWSLPQLAGRSNQRSGSPSAPRISARSGRASSLAD
jgi:hypothetical protein